MYCANTFPFLERLKAGSCQDAKTPRYMHAKSTIIIRLTFSSPTNLLTYRYVEVRSGPYRSSVANLGPNIHNVAAVQQSVVLHISARAPP